MSVHVSTDGVIQLSGRCENDDAETLLQALLAAPGSRVDWSDCKFAHSAVIQVLLIARPPMQGEPDSEVLNRWVAPLLGRGAR